MFTLIFMGALTMVAGGETARDIARAARARAAAARAVAGLQGLEDDAHQASDHGVLAVAVDAAVAGPPPRTRTAYARRNFC